MLGKIFKSLKKSNAISKDEIAKILKTSPKLLEKFESMYRADLIEFESDNLFEQNKKEYDKTLERFVEIKDIDSIINNIVNELMTHSTIYDSELETYTMIKDNSNTKLVDNKDISQLPEYVRPQFTGNLMQIDCDKNSSSALFFFIKKYIDTENIEYYHRFRQGLDILDIDPIMYEMLSLNKNTMGYWLPKIIGPIRKDGFFKIPKTKILKVPLPLLQSTRVLDYQELTPTSYEIINRYIKKALDLDEDKDYFVKTGTYSSKFDFRNAKVTGSKEVNELGSYLWFMQNSAVNLASPLNNKSIYGVSTTNEWVVREFIDDIEDNPTIYKGLPLHTEYRIFVDFDKNTVIGKTMYWDSKMMKDRFLNHEDSSSPHQIHDYIIYAAHEEKLYKRYEENIDRIVSNIEKVIENIDLSGQWSIDIMQNGEDFYIIDMALAKDSALNECVAKLIVQNKPIVEEWLPIIGE